MKRILLIAFSAFFILVGISFGQETQAIMGLRLRQGQVSPTDGVLFANESLMAIAGAMRELLVAREKVKLLEGQVGALDQESVAKDLAIAELQEAKKQMQIAIDKLEFINANHKLIEDAYKAAVEIYKQALIDTREDNKSLRSELWWTKIFSAIPIIGLIATAIHGF